MAVSQRLTQWAPKDPELGLHCCACHGVFIFISHLMIFMGRHKNVKKRQMGLHCVPVSATAVHPHAVVWPERTTSSVEASIVPNELTKETS